METVLKPCDNRNAFARIERALHRTRIRTGVLGWWCGARRCGFITVAVANGARHACNQPDFFFCYYWITRCFAFRSTTQSSQFRIHTGTVGPPLAVCRRVCVCVYLWVRLCKFFIPFCMHNIYIFAVIFLSIFNDNRTRTPHFIFMFNIYCW